MWQRTKQALSRQFEFDNFEQAAGFVRQVFDIARELDHHPKLTNEFNKVEISLSTHSAGGKVTQKDEEFAQKIDDLLKKNQEKPLELESAQLFTDGGSRGNPGPSAIGYAICNMDGNVVKKFGKCIGQSTNNQAEYEALAAGMKDCHANGVKNLQIFMDSELIVNQMQGKYKVKHQDLKPLYEKVKSLENDLDKVSYAHVARAQNKVADDLVNKALDKAEPA